MDMMFAATDTLDKTMGAFYIGVVLSGVMFGVVTLQGFSYYRSRSWADPVALRLLVLAIWCLDGTHQIFVSHAVYRYLISNFFNGGHLGRVLWTAIMEVLITGIIAMFVHGFYVTRIYHMSNRNVIVAALLALGAVAEFVVATIFSAKAVRIQSFSNLDQTKSWFIASNAIFAVVSCVMTIVYFVLLQSQTTKFKPNCKSTLTRGIAYCLDTGILPSLTAVASLIAVIVKPETFVYAPFIFCLGRLYSISLLSTLNGTGPNRPKPGTSTDSNNVYQPRPERHRMSNFGRGRGLARDVSIHIDTVQYVNRDDGEAFSHDKEKLSPMSPMSNSVPSAV